MQSVISATQIFDALGHLAVLQLSSKRMSASYTPIQEKTGSRMETRPKGPSVFASPGGKYKLDKQSLSKEFQDGATKY